MMMILTISNEWYIFKQEQVKSYFFAVAVVVAVLVGDCLDECVRFVRFFVSVLGVSPVKYEVMFDTNDDNDQEDFFDSVWRATPRWAALLGELSTAVNFAFRDLTKFFRATWLWCLVNFRLRTYLGST